MKGRRSRSNDKPDKLARSFEGRVSENNGEKEVFQPKKLKPVGGKKAQQRLDKPVRGARDAGAYARGGGIHIKESHKRLLHEKLGVPEVEPIPAGKLAKAKYSKSAAERKEATFAENAKHWNH